MNCFKRLLGATLLVSSGFIIAAEEHQSSIEQNRKELEHIVRCSDENQQTIDRVRQLLQLGVGDINGVNIDVHLLELAVNRVAPEWCRLLIQAGAQVNNPRFSISLGHLLTHYDNSPFLYAYRGIFDRGCAVMNLLIQHGYDINTQDRYGDTPLTALYFSCLGGGATREAAEYFLNHGADVTIPSKSRGGVRLIDNVQGNRLVEKAMKAFLAQRDLIRSIHNNDTAGIKNALLRGARVGLQDVEGNNAFHVAAMKIAGLQVPGDDAATFDAARISKEQTFNYLLSLPITNIERCLSVKNKLGMTPIEILIQNDNAQDILDGILRLSR